MRTAVPAWIAQFPRAAVYVCAADTLPEWHLDSLGARHLLDVEQKLVNWHLKTLGPVDVIVDLIPHSTADQRALFNRLFWHLKPRGVYVLDPAVTGADPYSAASAAWVSALLEGGGGAGARPDARRESQLGHSVARIDVSRDLVAIEKRNEHYLKMRDSETNRILPLRERSLKFDILDTVPAERFTCRGRVISHQSAGEIGALEEAMNLPQLSLRHYRGRIAMVSNQLLFTGATILPDSFRHSLAKNATNPLIVRSSAEFARIPARYKPADLLSGNYYHLDSENSGHFGHLMSEQLSRLWGWPEAKRQIPDLKLVFRIRHPKERNPVLEQRLFSAFGIALDDITWIDRPMYLNSVIAATPMWHNQTPHYAHPEIKARIWDPIADSLIDDNTPTYDKIFVSRQPNHKNRLCRNADEVERTFIKHGFEIVYPERLDLSQQAAIFAKARVVAGFGGSGMFNVLFARRLETLILLAHESYTARNEHLYASVLGCDSHYFWSTADIAHPDKGWSADAFYASWEFDFNRNAAELNDLLANL